MKKMISLLLCLCLAAGIAPVYTEEVSAKKPVFENGLAMPVFKYTDARESSYTNENSEILRFCVYVETDYDTDGDGLADLVEALVQVPRAAAEGHFKAAVIYDPTPYGAGTVDETGMDATKLMNPVPFDYQKLYEPGKKRTPAGTVATLDVAENTDNQTWNYKVPYSDASGYVYLNSYDYYLVRGFAVVEAGGIGTYGSEGFELCGFDLERDSHKAVVEWLTGDRVAFTDPYYNIEVKADWCNGNIAMTGCSYGGTLAFEVATTGVKGLKTVIPFAALPPGMTTPTSRAPQSTPAPPLPADLRPTTAAEASWMTTGRSSVMITHHSSGSFRRTRKPPTVIMPTSGPARITRSTRPKSTVPR